MIAMLLEALCGCMIISTEKITIKMVRIAKDGVNELLQTEDDFKKRRTHETLRRAVYSPRRGWHIVDHRTMYMQDNVHYILMKVLYIQEYVNALEHSLFYKVIRIAMISVC